MRKRPKFYLLFAAAFFAAPFTTCNVAFAQEPAPESPQEENPSSVKPPASPNQANANSNPNTNSGDNSNSDSSSIDHPPVVVSSTLPIRQIDGAGFLTPSGSPFRWGPIFLGSAQFAEIFDRGSAFNNQGSFQAAASQFVAHIIVDKQFRKAHLAFQYVPTATIVNGQFIGDFVNQDTGVNMVLALSPRLTLNFGDHVSYYKSSNSFADVFLSADPTTGATLQQNFLQGSASWLSNSVTASFGYMLSGRTRITVAPQYIYASTSGQATATTLPSVNEYGVNVSINHDLTPHSTITGLYTEQTDIFFGQSYNTIYQTFQGGYSHVFSGGWAINGTFGAITYNSLTGRAWSESGSGAITKGFRRSQLGLAYYRGHAFSGYISAAFNDRIDLTYLQSLGRRWSFSGGAGYQRSVVPSNGIWGKYAQGNVSFRLTRTLSLFSSYVHKWQAGDDVQVFTGTMDYVRAGISWSPPILNQ